MPSLDTRAAAADMPEKRSIGRTTAAWSQIALVRAALRCQPSKKISERPITWAHAVNHAGLHRQPTPGNV